MADWVSISLSISGKEEIISNIQKIFDDMIERSKNKDGEGTLPLFLTLTHNEGYFFNIYYEQVELSGDTSSIQIGYETPYSVNHLAILETFDKLGSCCLEGSYCETAGMLYGDIKYIRENKEYLIRELDQLEWESCKVLVDEGTDEVIMKRSDVGDDEWDDASEREGVYENENYDAMDDLLGYKSFTPILEEYFNK